MTKILQIISHSEDETLALAEKILGLLTPDDVVVLSGELGAGKTLFVRGLAKGLGLDVMHVNSPSYTIVNEYPGEKPLYHFDLYRITDPIELFEIGWDEYISRLGLVVVEWGENAGENLPKRYYLLEFVITDDNERDINLSLVEA